MKAEKEHRRDTGDNPAETGEKGDKIGDRIEPLAERTTEISQNSRRMRIHDLTTTT